MCYGGLGITQNHVEDKVRPTTVVKRPVGGDLSVLERRRECRTERERGRERERGKEREGEREREGRRSLEGESGV